MESWILTVDSHGLDEMQGTDVTRQPTKGASRLNHEQISGIALCPFLLVLTKKMSHGQY